MKNEGAHCSGKWLEAHKELFEQTLKEPAWSKESDGKYISALGDVEFRSFENPSDAVKHAEKIRMTVLADHAWWIVGDGNQYRGVTAKMCNSGN